MVIAMESKVLKNEAKFSDVLYEQFSVQQLIDTAVQSLNDEYVQTHIRQELISRGKDNIQVRIAIKKTCKAAIADLEFCLKKTDNENSTINKGITKVYKNKFLNTLSILDKLQLEWQRYDLGLKN